MAVCRHWKKGHCERGEKCGFEHPPKGKSTKKQQKRNREPAKERTEEHITEQIALPPPLEQQPPSMVQPAIPELQASVGEHPDRLAMIQGKIALPSTSPAPQPAKARGKRKKQKKKKVVSVGEKEDSQSMKANDVGDVLGDMPPPPRGARGEVGSEADAGKSKASLPPREAYLWQGIGSSSTSRQYIFANYHNADFLLSLAMGAQKRMSDGEPKAFVGPHPSFIRVSAQYQTQANVERKLQQLDGDHHERSIAEAKEDSLRLQGVQWIDVVRRALQLPVRTYTTACTYYHKFRLAHPPGTQTGDNYLWQDAAAASLLTACKMEDTLKKSRDILAASYNLKAATAHDQLPSDDPSFEPQSRAVIGLERMVLEASTFDFRCRAPHHTLTKIAMSLGPKEKVKPVHDIAWTALTDIYRTFAPLKQTSVTLALAMLELAARLTSSEEVLAAIRKYDLDKVNTTREQTMETILDSCDLYIQHTTAATLGTRYTIDDFLRLRLALKKECDNTSLPRNCEAPTEIPSSTTQVQNGHPTPVSPPQPDNNQSLPEPVILEHAPPVSGGTLRFMLNPQLAHDERQTVESYFKEEWEEYEEEIEVPIPRTERRPGPPSSRASSRDRRDERDRPPPPRTYDDRREERARVDRERAFDRDNRRPPPRERDPRDSRRYEDDRRRYPDERRYDERRYDDRRRDERRYPRDNRR